MFRSGLKRIHREKKVGVSGINYLKRYVVAFIFLASFFAFFLAKNNTDLNAPASSLFPTLEAEVKKAELPAKTEISQPLALPIAKLAGKKISLEVMRTPAELRRGLSGKLSLGKDAGMLFIFPKAGIYQFWMPDMHFPIDMIWIEKGVVVGMHQNVSNEFDPKNPKFYSVKTPAKYVLEVNAGWSRENGLKVGDKVEFQNI